jgi:hypothetical protein
VPKIVALIIAFSSSPTVSGQVIERGRYLHSGENFAIRVAFSSRSSDSGHITPTERSALDASRAR